MFLSDLRAWAQRVLSQPLDPNQLRRHLHPVYLLRLIVEIARNWARDRCPQQAANLTFQTTLSLVPLIAVSFALLQWSHMLEARSALVEFFTQHVLPVSSDKLAETLLGFAENVRVGATIGFGILIPLVLAYLLFATMEKMFNDIWRVGRRRSLWAKFWVFYPLATLSPVVVGLTLYYTARFWRGGGFVGFVANISSTFVFLSLANKLLPRTRVQWIPAAVGALVSSILFEAAKRGFQAYVKMVAFSSFEGIYGSLGLFPILLLWIYYSWLVVLFGAEVAYSVQNLPAIEEQKRRHIDRTDIHEEMARTVNGKTAVNLLLAVARHFQAGETVLARDELMRRFQLSEAVIERIFDTLIERGFVVYVSSPSPGYIPAKPLAELSVDQVMDAFDSELDTTDAAYGPVEDALRRAQTEVLNGLSLAELLRREEVCDEPSTQTQPKVLPDPRPLA